MVENEVDKNYINFGDVFKSKRLEMSLSLKEVSNATSIRANYLAAIENETIASLLPTIYARGFIVQYANYLGLNAEQLLEDNPHVIPKNGNNFSCKCELGSMEQRGSAFSKLKDCTSRNIFWGFAFILAIIAAWLFARYVGLI